MHRITAGLIWCFAVPPTRLIKMSRPSYSGPCKQCIDGISRICADGSWVLDSTISKVKVNLDISGTYSSSQHPNPSAPGTTGSLTASLSGTGFALFTTYTGDIPEGYQPSPGSPPDWLPESQFLLWRCADCCSNCFPFFTFGPFPSAGVQATLTVDGETNTTDTDPPQSTAITGSGSFKYFPNPSYVDKSPKCYMASPDDTMAQLQSSLTETLTPDPFGAFTTTFTDGTLTSSGPSPEIAWLDGSGTGDATPLLTDGFSFSEVGAAVGINPCDLEGVYAMSIDGAGKVSTYENWSVSRIITITLIPP